MSRTMELCDWFPTQQAHQAAVDSHQVHYLLFIIQLKNITFLLYLDFFPARVWTDLTGTSWIHEGNCFWRSQLLTCGKISQTGSLVTLPCVFSPANVCNLNFLSLKLDVLIAPWVQMLWKMNGSNVLVEVWPQGDGPELYWLMSIRVAS